jgi:hypothetical protein
MAPEEIMARQEMKNVTSTVIAPSSHSSQEMQRRLLLFKKTTQKLFSRGSLQRNQLLERNSISTVVQKPYRICTAAGLFCVAVTFQ